MRGLRGQLAWGHGLNWDSHWDRFDIIFDRMVRVSLCQMLVELILSVVGFIAQITSIGPIL